jgi:integrase
LRELDPFQLQVWLNKLAERYSGAVVRHAYINLRAILKMARKLKFLSENPAEDLDMPETREVVRPVLSAEQICTLIDGVQDLRDRTLLCVGLFCATRASETFGLTWKSYLGDRLLVQSTAFEGEFYEGRVKTSSSKTTVPLPEDIRSLIEAWKNVCKDTSPNALMFSTFGRGKRTGSSVPFHSKNFLRCKVAPIAEQLGIPKKLVTFQVMRRTLGTDMQGYGSLKDAQMVLRHASITTTGNVYVQEIAESTVRAINARTKAVLAARKTAKPEPGSDDLQDEASELQTDAMPAAVAIGPQGKTGRTNNAILAKKGEAFLVGEDRSIAQPRNSTGSNGLQFENRCFVSY